MDNPGSIAALALLAVALALGLGWARARRLLTEQAQRTAAAEARQRGILDGLNIGLVVWDPQDRLSVWNRDFELIYPHLAPELRVGRGFEELLRVALDRGLVPEARGREDAWLAERLGAHRRASAPIRRQMADGRWRLIVERFLHDGSLLSYSVDVTDFVRQEQELQRLNAELDAANRRLAELSETDALTGLANRRHFDRRLGEEWLRALRHGIPLALLLVDVDHFKRYNDRHGHPAGDACLRRIADLLKGCARRADELVARYGGEEFVVLLPHCSAEEAALVAERCRTALQQAALPHGDSPLGPSVTLSIGVASIPLGADEESPHQLLQLADEALYRAKREGRDRVVAAHLPA